MPEEIFEWKAEQFADIKILRYQVPGFESLSLQQKKLLYYLSEAALCGRDIIFDQNGRYNLLVRKTLEAVVKSYSGNKDNPQFDEFMVYTRRVWFSNGIYHHYSNDKLVPGFSKEYFRELLSESDPALLPLNAGETPSELAERLVPVLFDPSFQPRKVSQEEGTDLLKGSAVNFYDGLGMEEARSYYKSLQHADEENPPSFGLNSKLIKDKGQIKEIPWKIDGLYGPAIQSIIYWLEKAREVAETKSQARVIELLCEFYRTGDLKVFDDYSIAWVKETNCLTDFVNGFIEVYNDPLGIKASWEALVNFKDMEATRRTEIISSNAQWFEDHSPVDPRFKKKEVRGVSAKVINAVMLGGDCYPATPIGINLPNADWIRTKHGSKSVTLQNITHAYDQAAKGSGFIEEFACSEEEIEWNKKYSFISDNLHTDLHECLGHGSGQLLPGVNPEALSNYHSTLEEARADLYALYFLMDERMTELGLLPHPDAARYEYTAYMRNGLFTQLVRVEEGKNIEEAHMRNRALIARWCFEKGKENAVIEQLSRDGKTYFKVNDYGKLRILIGKLLAEVQRIKSEGDYPAAKNLVENYAVQVDPNLHREVLERYRKLKLAPYSGFINPELKPVLKGNEVVDIEITYPNDFCKQMLTYSEQYSFLPITNPV
jgi:dipeptidyl-peptidase-3